MRDTCRLAVVALTVLLLVAACATLGTRLEGRSDPIAWQATDLALVPREVGGRTLWYYTFELLVREVGGTGVTFNEIQTAIYQPGTGSGGTRFRGVWRLDANDEFRIPLQSTLSCHPTAGNCLGPNVPIPLWRIRMNGTDDRKQPVAVVIDLTLPADPPAPPTTTSKSVRAISLTPPTQAGPPTK
jgi:hypothetical protein